MAQQKDNLQKQETHIEDYEGHKPPQAINVGESVPWRNLVDYLQKQ